jgi:hypothetical protein
MINPTQIVRPSQSVAYSFSSPFSSFPSPSGHAGRGRSFSSLEFPYRVWDQCSFLCVGYRWSFPRVKEAPGVKPGRLYLQLLRCEGVRDRYRLPHTSRSSLQNSGSKDSAAFLHLNTVYLAGIFSVSDTYHVVGTVHAYN